MDTSCRQTELPVEGGGHQFTHKTFTQFNPKSVLPTRCAGKKMKQRLRECQSITGARSDPFHERPTLTLLIRLCYASRREPSMTVLRAFTPQLMETDAEPYSQTTDVALVVLWKSGRQNWVIPQEDLQRQLTRVLGAQRDWTTKHSMCRAGPRCPTYF